MNTSFSYFKWKIATNPQISIIIIIIIDPCEGRFAWCLKNLTEAKPQTPRLSKRKIIIIIWVKIIYTTTGLCTEEECESIAISNLWRTDPSKWSYLFFLCFSMISANKNYGSYHLLSEQFFLG